MPDQPWWRCAKAPKSRFVSKIAWVGKWCGNGTTDWTAIIVNNHVTHDRWRGKLDFLSDRLLAKRIDRAIYWYQKGCWDKLSEDQLLDYWVSLEALVGLEDKEKRTIPFRAGLLAPVMTPVDGHTTYGQLRSWTREFIEDVYQLRNEIVHGGIFEGPSFERFVDRLRSTLHGIIVVVLYPFISGMPVPESLEEVLAWIWHKNPDNQVAAPRKPS